VKVTDGAGEGGIYGDASLLKLIGPDNQEINLAWAELRDAQFYASNLPHTGMAVITDIGDANDVHPKNKQEVGRRLALMALNDLYNKPTVASGPQLKNWKVQGNTIVLTLNPIGKKIVATDNIAQGLKGFTIAGEDGKYVPALALLKGNQVIVSASSIQKPVSVRYAWANNPDLSLFNDAGLPSSPFSTATWKKN